MSTPFTLPLGAFAPDFLLKATDDGMYGLADFDDVRDIQKTLKARGIVPVKEADQASTGPAHLVLTDPDGNPVLIDQHVPKPAR